MTTHSELLHKVEAVIASTSARYWDTFNTFHNAGSEIRQALQALKEFASYDEYDALRVKFMGTRPASVKPDAAKKQWSRLVQDAKVSIPKKPKSENVETKQKQDKRAALRALTDEELQAAIDLEKKLDRKATQLLAEQKRRAELAAKPEADKLLTEVESIIERGGVDLEKLLTALKKGQFKIKSAKGSAVN